MKYSAALSALTLCFVGCIGASKDAPSMLSMAARNGVSWSHQLLTTGTVRPVQRPRPGAMLGPYLAHFLSSPPIGKTHAAFSGIHAGVSMLRMERGLRDESYAMLEELGLILHVDLADRLNRALDRAISLDSYREGLIQAATRSNNHLMNLAEREDEARTRVRELRSRTSTIQRSLRDALRAKDYATAGSQQSELSLVHGELAVAMSQQKEIASIINVFEESLETAAERLEAIDANREALIAGVSVTDIPGTTDIGVLEESTRGRRRSDPDDVFGSPNATE